eukprot:scaffold112631_cov15-Tisochrysis_lutea.AAC.1
MGGLGAGAAHEETVCEHGWRWQGWGWAPRPAGHWGSAACTVLLWMPPGPCAPCCEQVSINGNGPLLLLWLWVVGGVLALGSFLGAQALARLCLPHMCKAVGIARVPLQQCKQANLFFVASVASPFPNHGVFAKGLRQTLPI